MTKRLFRFSTDEVLIYDPEKRASVIVNVIELRDERTQLQQNIVEVYPNTNVKKLQWFEDNYAMTGEGQYIQQAQERIAQITQTLDDIRDLLP